MEAKVSSVGKALSILDCFSISRPELSLAQISAELGIPKSTALNQIRTLEDRGFLYRVANTANYRLGYKIMQLNYCVHSSLPIVQYALPIMEELKNRTHCNVYLTSHIDGRVFYLEGMYYNKRTIAYSDSGKTLPMHCTGSGKAMLSYMPDAQVQAVIDRWGLPEVTENTITDPMDFRRELEVCRGQGYAVDNEEESVGVRCVAAAVRSSRGEVAGALSLSGPAVSMNESSVLSCAALVKHAAAELLPYAQFFPAMQLQAAAE